MKLRVSLDDLSIVILMLFNNMTSPPVRRKLTMLMYVDGMTPSGNEVVAYSWIRLQHQETKHHTKHVQETHHSHVSLGLRKKL